ncbi:SET domain-containing protein [Rickenella mellea]|uniref:SET domain-containing protein n=1 Tax=Rickenella mellea TaxID=50990 RepID=A0A4Y7QIJ8_9AGAM|nr:SET domain-containing protein [Rickenella mellea]
MSGEDQLWDNLLRWLASKGMDTSAENLPVHPLASSHPGAGRGLFTTSDIQPHSPVLNIPASALLNVYTLAPIYPFLPVDGRSPFGVAETIFPPLSASQLLALHIAIHRPTGISESTDPCFGPYICTLPNDFASHPLMWVLGGDKQAAKPDQAFWLNALPPSALVAVQAVAKRFNDDWETIVRCLKLFGDAFTTMFKKNIAPLISEENFRWAWLNVNTRCIYFRLFAKKSHRSNLTLCPIMDFMNHTRSPHHPQITPRIEPDVTGIEDSYKRRNPVLLSPANRSVRAGEELYLQYGGHCNTTLFAEYGFVDTNRDSFEGEADISDLINARLLQMGENGLHYKAVLEAERYTDGWKLYSSPSPAHASWTLLAALRLTNLDVPGNDQDRQDEEAYLKSWRDMLSGCTEIISETNETAVAEDLTAFCKTILERGEKKLDILDSRSKAFDGVGTGCWASARANITWLWQEEMEVAQEFLETACKAAIR